MNKVAIYAGGEMVNQVDKSLPFIAVDSGFYQLQKLGIRPIVLIGDFDSLIIDSIDTQGIDVIKYPTCKDETDTRLAIDYALKHEYHEIILYGVTGKRQDHFLSLVRTLHQYQEIKLKIMDDYNLLYLLPKGIHKVHKNDYSYISFFSLHDVILSLEGVKYPLQSRLVKAYDDYNVSNQIIADHCIIEVSNTIIVVQTRD